MVISYCGGSLHCTLDHIFIVDVKSVNEVTRIPKSIIVVNMRAILIWYDVRTLDTVSIVPSFLCVSFPGQTTDTLQLQTAGPVECLKSVRHVVHHQETAVSLGNVFYTTVHHPTLGGAWC